MPVRNVQPGYGSVLVTFDPLSLSYELVEKRAASVDLEDGNQPESRTIEVPVCYGGVFGPDLDDVASAANLAPEEVVRLHASADYLVYFLGFSAGFPYLGGMPDRIAAPRLPQPRTSVPAGSVGIAGRQTGIYPFSSPGGWRIIGRTPLSLFHPQADRPTLLEMGDRVGFVPIDEEEFERRLHSC